MPSILFLCAGTLAGVWFVVHLLLGGRDIARPLLASTELDPMVRDVQYLCWHFTSVGIAAMSGFFVWAGVVNDPSFAVAATLMAAGFAITGILLVIKQGARHLVVPQGWLFVPVAALGAAGLLL